MCRTFLTVGGMPMPDELGERGETPRFVDVGDSTSLVVRRWGRGGLEVEWSQTAFGLRSHSGGTLSHAQLDRAEMLRGFEGIATKLCAIPLYGYRWRKGDEWSRVPAGWALGAFDPASGFLLFSAGDVSPMLIVAGWPDARRWLLSETWEQMRLLRGIADDMDGSRLVEARRAS